MTISVLIADDEQPAIDELAFLLGQDPRIGVIHQAAEQGSCGKGAECDQEDAPPAEQICHPAAQQEQTSVTEHVGGDDPLE